MTSTGWFQVAWSADIAVGEVKGLRYFGTDLVVYRGLDGVVRAHDRYCQHLGASLAHGGVVVEEGIRCPFHGWVWGIDGCNVAIPYQDRPNAARKVRAWPVAERNAAVYLWYDSCGAAPQWEIPDYFTALGEHISGRTYYESDPPERSHFPELNVAPQLVAENAVDPHHFRFVHGTPVSPVVVEEHVEGPSWQAKVGFGRRWNEIVESGTGDRAETMNTLTLIFWGLGVSANGELTRDGARVISICTTPVDDDTSEIFATYWIEQTERNDPEERERRVAEAKLALPDDINIWHHQIYLEPPGLATSEAAGFRRLRRWSSQFYPEAPVAQ